jgi:hypothetical protein
MLISELFETQVAEKIEPVIKVSETGDEQKLASELGSYVVTPSIEKYLAGFLDHYTDTFQVDTTEIGVWISGYFGSGKSHLAKVMGLLAENRRLVGASACSRFEARLPLDTPEAKTIRRALARIPQCDTRLLAFNVNTLADSKATPLPKLLLSQFYQSKGYGSNLLYARVIEAELDLQGRLPELHAAVEASCGRAWADIQKNPTFFQRHLYAAASQIAPDAFPTPQTVGDALQKAQAGELYNVGFFIDTLLADLASLERESRRKQRLMLVLDESGQWIEGDKDRLAQLQSLIEEAAVKGQGRIWIVVTTHGDMGSVLKEAKALEGDMKKIEGRFRYKFSLTTENIELVLEDRLFKKSLPGRQELDAIYKRRGGVLRDVGEMRGERVLPACTADKFTTYYPFFPYQVSLIPEIVKSLRSRGGRGEQLSGSTRTLLAITQDILRAGRRSYLGEAVGPVVSFDEVYGNLAGEGEVSPDVRDELGRIPRNVKDATALTQHVAEVLYLVRELPFLVRSKENIARLLVTDVDDDVAALVEKVEPELERLRQAKLVGITGDEYEFLTGEKRTFEEEVGDREHQLRAQDKERGLADHFFHQSGRGWWKDWMIFEKIQHEGYEFDFRLTLDTFPVPGRTGDVTLRVNTPFGRETLQSLEDRSLRSDEQNTVFVFSAAVARFDDHLSRYLAMKEIIGTWIGDTHRSEEAKRLARERERDDLPKVRKKVLDDLKDGLARSHVVFRGSSRQVSVPTGKDRAEALRAEVAAFWPIIYPKLERLPVRIANEDAAIRDVLAGGTSHRDVVALKLFDKAGKLDPSAVVTDAIRVFLAGQQSRQRRVLGNDLLAEFSAPPYGWDPNALRVGIAALVRAGTVKLVLNKKPFTNPADPDLVDAIRVARNFEKVEIVLEDSEPDPDELAAVRTLLRRIAKKRDIDETPAALAEVAGQVAGDVEGRADRVRVWASPANFPLPTSFDEAVEAWAKVTTLKNPVHRVHEVFLDGARLEQGYASVNDIALFQAGDGPLFVEMARLVRDLVAVEHRIDEASPIRAFLSAFEHARKTRGLAEKETWRHLRSLEASARLELSVLLDKWRAAARDIAQGALDDAKVRAPGLGVAEATLATLGKPLRAFLDGLDETTGTARVAALPEVARQHDERFQRALLEEAARQRRPEPPKPDPGNGGGGGDMAPEPPPKLRVKRALRVRDVAAGTVIRDSETWNVVREQLDREVHLLLDGGFDVEIA